MSDKKSQGGKRKIRGRLRIDSMREAKTRGGLAIHPLRGAKLRGGFASDWVGGANLSGGLAVASGGLRGISMFFLSDLLILAQIRGGFEIDLLVLW